MLVIPTRLGYYGYIRRYPKDNKKYAGPFKLQHPSHFSKLWMQACDPKGKPIEKPEVTYDRIKAEMKRGAHVTPAPVAPAKVETKTGNNPAQPMKAIDYLNGKVPDAPMPSVPYKEPEPVLEEGEVPDLVFPNNMSGEASEGSSEEGESVI